MTNFYMMLHCNPFYDFKYFEMIGMQKMPRDVTSRCLVRSNANSGLFKRA